MPRPSVRLRRRSADDEEVHLEHGPRGPGLLRELPSHLAHQRPDQFQARAPLAGLPLIPTPSSAMRRRPSPVSWSARKVTWTVPWRSPGEGVFQGVGGQLVDDQAERHHALVRHDGRVRVRLDAHAFPALA